jgi:hypothetical protein
MGYNSIRLGTTQEYLYIKRSPPSPEGVGRGYLLVFFKGIVQRDLTGVETRLKKSVLLSYSVGKFLFLFLRDTITRKA